MPPLLIVPGLSRIDLTARPPLPGARLAVDRVAGWMEPGGGGALTLVLRAVLEDDRAPGLPRWLRGGPVTVAGVIESVRQDGRRVEVRTRFTAEGRAVALRGSGRVGPTGAGEDGDTEAVGVTLVDPRMLGYALPPLITYAVTARWRLHLTASR